MAEHTCSQCGAPAPAPVSAGTPALCPTCAAAGETRVSPQTRRAGATLAPGGVVGPYEIVRELGRGGMAVVYRARQPALDRDVALKVLRTTELTAAGMVERFLREGRAAARLSHPNIVPVYDVGAAGDIHYLAMELVPGRSLDAHITEGELDWREAARIVRDVARGLQYAHEHGVVHRDVKPANILLTESGVPRVADFGLAQLEGATGLTAEGSAIGTPSYMAPEQAAGDRAAVGPRTDVYACGAVLYECLVCAPPFDGATVLEVLRAVQTQEPAPLRRRRPDVPADLATVVEKALAKARTDRYSSAADLAEDLDRLLSGQAIHASAIGPVGRGVRAVRRRPWAFAGGAALVVAAVVTGGAVWTVARAPGGGATPLVDPAVEAARAKREREAAAERKRREAAAQQAREALQRAQERFAVVVSARKAGDRELAGQALAEALTHVETAIAAAPTAAGAYVLRARCRDLSHDPDGAAADYDRALELDPKLPDAYYERARLWFDRIFATQVGLGMHDAFSEAALRADIARMNALGARPERAHAAAAMVHLLSGEFEAAIREADASIAEDRLFPDAYDLRAGAHTALGLVSRAFGDRSLLEQHLHTALTDFDAAETRGYDPAHLNVGRSLALGGLGRVDEALAAADTVLTLAPGDGRTYVLRAQYHLLLGHTNACDADLAEAGRLLGPSPEVPLGRAIVRLGPALARLGGQKDIQGPAPSRVQLEAARRDLDWVVKHAPGYPIARFFRAVTDQLLARPLPAAADLQVFIAQTTSRSMFRSAATKWFAFLRTHPVIAKWKMEGPLWDAVRGLGKAEAAVLSGDRAAAAQHCRALLADLNGDGGPAPPPQRGKDWDAELRRNLRQFAHLTLARLAVRQAAALEGGAPADALPDVLAHLDAAIAAGFADATHLQRDPYLQQLAAEPPFAKRVAELEQARAGE